MTATTASSASFTPRPNDWGRLKVEQTICDSDIEMSGAAGRRLRIENPGSRRPILLYKAHGMCEFVAEGNLRNPKTRAFWAREIAGPSADIQAGIKADLEQAAGEFHRSFTFLTEGV